MKTLKPMPPRAHFFRRMVQSVTIALSLIGGGLVIGMVGYHAFGGLGWREAFYYAAMSLSGGGAAPHRDPPALAGPSLARLHIFAGLYALFSGVTFITMVGVLMAPALHRFLHRFHLEISRHDEDDQDAR